MSIQRWFNVTTLNERWIDVVSTMYACWLNRSNRFLFKNGLLLNKSIFFPKEQIIFYEGWHLFRRVVKQSNRVASPTSVSITKRLWQQETHPRSEHNGLISLSLFVSSKLMYTVMSSVEQNCLSIPPKLAQWSKMIRKHNPQHGEKQDDVLCRLIYYKFILPQKHKIKHAVFSVS